MPPLVIAGGVAGAATLGGAIIAKKGADNAADAAEKAGNAQLQAAREEITAANQRLDKEIAERRRIQEMAMASAVKSPTEIAAISRIIQTRDSAWQQQKAELDKQFALLEAADPGIKEAGTQLYSLMKGEQTKMMDPVLKNRATQKAKLEAQLSRTLGPGFRTTSAGIKALESFDMGTDVLVFQVQQQAIDTAQKVYQGGVQTRAGAMAGANDVYRTVSALDSAAASIEQGAKARETNAVIGAASAAPVNFGAIQEATRNAAQYASAPFAGDIMRGQNSANLGGAIMNAGLSIGGQAFGNFMTGEMLKGVKSAPGGQVTDDNYGGLSVGRIPDTTTRDLYGSLIGP